MRAHGSSSLRRDERELVGEPVVEIACHPPALLEYDGPFDVREVGDRGHADLSTLIGDAASSCGAPEPGAIAANADELRRWGRGGGESIRDGLVKLRLDEGLDRHTHYSARLVAKQRPEGGVRAHDDALVADADAISRCLREAPEALFAFAERRLGEDLVRDLPHG